jgi:hypothetical protein
MVTQDAFEPHPERSRWLRRAGAAAIATAVLGVGGTGFVVAALSTQPESSAGTTASSDDSGASSDDSGSSNSSSDDQGSSSSSGSGLGSTHQNSPTQGGSNGS